MNVEGAVATKPVKVWHAYLVAISLTLAVLLLRVALAPWVGDRPILILFFIPIVISAYLGGLGPGLLATALVGLVTDLFVLPPLGSLWFEKSLDFAQWLFMLLEGVLISVLFAELERRRRRIRRNSFEAKHATTERKVRVGFAVVFTILGAIGVASYLSVDRLTENSRVVAKSHAVMASIDALVVKAAEAEAAQRGFVLTGEEHFAADFSAAAGNIGGLLEQLHDLVADDRLQAARVSPLGEAIRARLFRSAQMIQVRRTGGSAAVDDELHNGRLGVDLQARLRALAQEMKESELKLLAEREAQALYSTRTAIAVIIGGTALALVFVALALFVIRRDFAGRERAEAELNRFFDLSIDLFVIASGTDGTFHRVSNAITEILGYTVDEALSISYMALIHPEDQPRALVEIEKQMVRNERVDRFDARFLHKDGSWRVLSWRSMPQGELMYATARDVTDAVRAEQDLRESKDMLESRVAERTRELEAAYETLHKSERRFRALIENGADSIALIDANNTILYLSPAVAKVEGYRPEELIGRPGTEHTHPDDLPVLAQVMEQLLANPGTPFPAVWRRRHKDGHWMWLEGVATNLLDDPSVRAIVTNYRDITPRLEQEHRQREQLQRLALLSRITRAIGERQDLRSIFQVFVRTLEDELPVDFCCILLYDMAEHRLTVNYVGANSAPLASQLAMDENAIVPIDENGLARCLRGHLVYEADIAAKHFPFPQRLAAGGLASLVITPLLVESQVFGVLINARRTINAFSSGECEFLRQASEHIALASHQAQLYSALQQAYDDLRHTQQQVMQQERLRALGQMASGIAHDINNAISPVALYTEALLERETNLSERARGYLEIIQRAVDDVAQTVSRMGEFYRLREPQLSMVPVDANKLIRQVIDLTRARWSDMAQQRGAAIDVRTDLTVDLPPIAAVESQIRDALVNLVFNAVDAMPQGGPLIIRTRVESTGKAKIVHLEVIDQGVGMDEDTRRRCLEPFFTTKGMRGTGLGLAMVYGVAQRHGAALDIESEPGKGTLVRLSFPVGAAGAAKPAAIELPIIPMQRILIVDDDPLLLKSLRDALESDGHEVTPASGGQAGIDAFVESHANGTPYPVVITDLGMPHVDGRRVAATIKTSCPQTVVIMLTGWGRRLVAEGDIPPGVDVILSKPPKLVELRAALAAQLTPGPSTRA